jgi:riboflavin synthase
MFTGIVTTVGTIEHTRALGEPSTAFGLRLVIAAPAGFLDGVAPGDSIALNGACMTVTSLAARDSRFEVDISGESLARTTGLDKPGRINLELALRMGDRLGGHLVSGHVDGVGSIERMRTVGESTEMVLNCPPELGHLIAVKGSLVVNGVSLTVNRLEDGAGGCRVSINLIPHTMAHTTLGELAPGSRVNLEIDLIARYVDRLVSAPKIQTR